jgi:hypothetical protein
MRHALYEVLELLDAARLHYTLARFAPDAVTVQLTVVGARYEINVHESGEILTSAFAGDESLEEGIKLIQQIVDANRD